MVVSGPWPTEEGFAHSDRDPKVSADRIGLSSSPAQVVVAKIAGPDSLGGAEWLIRYCRIYLSRLVNKYQCHLHTG